MDFIEKVKDLINHNDNLEKEVLDIINGLSTLENEPTVGYNTVITSLEVSKEGMDKFIELLENGEYIKAYSSNDDEELKTSVHKSEKYYLTFGKGILLEIEFIESKHQDSKDSHISAKMYVNLKDFTIKITHESSGFKSLRFIHANGDRIFGISEIKDSYVEFCNNKLVSEVIFPTSITELENRFINKLENKDAKKAPKLED